MQAESATEDESLERAHQVQHEETGLATARPAMTSSLLMRSIHDLVQGFVVTMTKTLKAGAGRSTLGRAPWPDETALLSWCAASGRDAAERNAGA